MMKKAFIDLGNTRCKIRCGETGNVAFDYGKNWTAKCIELLRSDSVRQILLLSSNLNKEEELVNALPEEISCTPLMDFMEEIGALDNIDFSGVRGMGDDRKLNIIAGINSLAQDMPEATTLAVIEYGTASTLTAAIYSSEKKKWLVKGGAIWAGASAQQEALAKLSPNLIKGENPNGLGPDTGSAISCGIFTLPMLGALSLVQSLGERPCPTYITGGAIKEVELSALPQTNGSKLYYRPELKGNFVVTL